MIRIFIISVLGIWLFPQPSLFAQIVYEAPSKKLVEFSHKSPSTIQYYENVTFYDSVPFDGISVKLSGAVGGGKIFMVEDWERILDEDRQKEYQMVKKLGEQFTLEHNFLVLYGASQLDWFSDKQWQQVEEHIRYAANLARIGKFKGILWDPEPYKPGKNPWKYPEQSKIDQYSFYEYYEQVRKRGSQFIEAIQEEFPGAVVLSLREFSDFLTASPFSQKILPASDLNAAVTKLENAWWGLHLPFTLGILESIGEEIKFIDGNEEAYYYTSAIEYYKVRHEIADDLRSLVPPGLHRKFKGNYHIGHAVSTDYIIGNWFGLLNGFSNRLTGQGVVLDAQQKAMWFEHNLYYALKTSDEYVWLYSEEPNWWTGEHVPEGFLEGLNRAKMKVDKLQPLGFTVESMLEEARNKAGKLSKNK